MSKSPYVINSDVANSTPGSWEAGGQAGGADPDGRRTCGAFAVPMAGPGISDPGSGTVAGPATWLTIRSTPKPTRAAVSTPSAE